MAVIFAGGELSSFTKFNSIETTLAGSFSLPARCGIHTRKGGFIRTDVLGDLSDIWIHFDMYVGTVTAGLTPISVTNSSGVVLFSIASDGKVSVAGSNIGILPAFTQGRFTYDVHLKGGSVGLVEVYVDSQAMLSVNGNFALSNMHTLMLSPVGVNANDSTTNSIYSQIIVANEITIGSKLATLTLDAVGSNNAWVGTSSNAAADVNEIGLDDTTYISAQTAGLVETWATSDLDPQYTNVRAVVVSALAKYSATGPKNIDAITRIGTGNYASAMTALGPGYTPSQAIFSINPVTNAAWTVSDVNAAEFGIRSKV